MPSITRRDFNLALMAPSGAGLLLENHAAALENVAEREARPGSITDVPGVRSGHFTDSRRPTGCTALIFDQGATAGVDFDGSAPGESQVVMLQPVSPLETIHGMLLTGGGPMGLGAVAGAVRYLEEQKIGYDWGVRNVRVPIVIGAVIDDLSLGDGRIRPDPDSAYQACQAASSHPVAEGNVGAGAGATVGKMLHGYPGMKGGLGTASLRAGEVVIAALVVLNAAGDIVDPQSNSIIAGARRPDGKGFADIVSTLRASLAERGARSALRLNDAPLRSTTLVVVATNVAFSKTQLTKIALMANCGAARVIRPYHTTGDGDQLFAVSTNRLKADIGITTVGALAAEVVADAVLRAIRTARSIEGWPAWVDVSRS